MSLISCNGCGVVLDKDKLNFPSNIYVDNGDIDDHLAGWNGDFWTAKVECPVCKEEILERE